MTTSPIPPIKDNSDTNPMVEEILQSNQATADQIAQTNTNQQLSDKEKQELAVFVIMVIALIDALVVGSQGMISRSKAISAVSSSMDQVQGSIAELSLKDVPTKQMETKRGSWNWGKAKYDHSHIQINTGEIQQVQEMNKVVMQSQMAGNLRLGSLQQAADIQASQADSATQSLQMVVNQITGTLETMKDSTFAAALTKPVSGS